MREATLNRAKPGSIFRVCTSGGVVYCVEKCKMPVLFHKWTISLRYKFSVDLISYKDPWYTTVYQFEHCHKFQNNFGSLQYLYPNGTWMVRVLDRLRQ
jgi:hypothetical protein